MGGTVEAAHARNALVVAAVGQVSSRLFELMLPTLAVVIASQTVTPFEQAIGWTGLAYLLYGVGALPAGVIVNRVPARLAVIVSVFGSGVAALAGSEAANGRVLSFCLGVMGLCAGACRPGAVALLHRGTLDWRRAQRGAVWAGRVAMVVTPALIAAGGAWVGWRPTLRGVGYALCALAVAASFLPLRENAVPARADQSERSRADRIGRSTVPALGAAALTALAGLGVMLIEPWYLASRVTLLGYGPATSAVVAAGLVGSIALGRRARSGEASRARLLWHGIAIIALVLMTVSTDTALLAVAAVLTGCSLAARAADDRALARMFADRTPALAAGLSAAWTGSAAALAVPLVAATAGNGGGVALLWIAGVEVLALAAAALRLSMRRDAVGAAPLNGEPDDRPYALLAPGSRTEPPSSC